VVSIFVIASISDLDERGTWDFSFATVASNVGAAGRLVVEDTRLMLLIPFQICFGFASSFVPYYILGTVIAGSDALGSTYVGLLSAVIVATGASMALPSAWAANAFGKPVVMVVGGLCLASAGGALFVFSNAQLGTWGLIIPYLVIYGVGRGTWVSVCFTFICVYFICVHVCMVNIIEYILYTLIFTQKCILP
jgi:hypothetical protein